MSNRRKRRESFFKSNPMCCFCGGIKKATEIDHQPPKIFFINKSSPRELRFPSCEKCNRSSRSLDIVFAFFSRFDPSGKFTHNFSQIENMINALHNNYPTTKPYFISNNDKRKAFKNMKKLKPDNVFWKDVPMIGFNKNVLKMIDLSLAKLGVGLFYLSQKSLVPVGAKIIVLTEKNILIKPPMQLDLLKIDFKEFLFFKNPLKLAQEQLGVSLLFNKKENFFLAKIRVNLSILSTVVIFLDNKDYDAEKIHFTLDGSCFPWGIDLEKLLKGEPTDMYYEEL